MREAVVAAFPLSLNTRRSMPIRVVRQAPQCRDQQQHHPDRVFCSTEDFECLAARRQWVMFVFDGDHQQQTTAINLGAETRDGNLGQIKSPDW
jgi:hypothetical protein